MKKASLDALNKQKHIDCALGRHLADENLIKKVRFSKAHKSKVFGYFSTKFYMVVCFNL